MRGLVVAAVIAPALPAHADDGAHMVYGELLGKGGLYGVGYEHRLAARLSAGAAGSFAVIRDQQVLTFSPYLHATLVAGTRHALFAELGAIVAHARVPSPVMDWDGTADTGAGGFASLGWERASRHLVLRASGSVVVGEGGLGPMLGIAIGVRP